MGEDEAYDRYYPEEDRSLSDAVLDAIEQQKGHNLIDEDFQLYDDVDPDALDNIFRADASTDTSVQFNTGDVTVTLWGDGSVEIRVTPRDDE